VTGNAPVASFIDGQDNSDSVSIAHGYGIALTDAAIGADLVVRESSGAIDYVVSVNENAGSTDAPSVNRFLSIDNVVGSTDPSIIRILNEATYTRTDVQTNTDAIALRRNVFLTFSDTQTNTDAMTSPSGTYGNAVMRWNGSAWEDSGMWTLARTALCANPSFETNASGWASDGPVSSFARAADGSAILGSFSGLVTWGTGASGSQSVNYTLSGLTIGRTYNATLWAKVPTGSPTVAISVYALADGTGTGSVKDAWEKLTVTFVATDTSHLLGVALRASATAGQTVSIDAIEIDDVAWVRREVRVANPGRGQIFDSAGTSDSIEFQTKSLIINDAAQPSANADSTLRILTQASGPNRWLVEVDDNAGADDSDAEYLTTELVTVVPTTVLGTQTSIASTQVLTLSATPTVGKTLILAMCAMGTATPTSVVDSKGNVWTVRAIKDNAGSPTAALTTVAIATCVNTAGLASGNTVTVTWSGAGTLRSAALYLPGMDVSTTTPVNVLLTTQKIPASNSVTLGPITPTSANAYVFAVVGYQDTQPEYMAGSSTTSIPKWLKLHRLVATQVTPNLSKVMQTMERIISPNDGAGPFTTTVPLTLADGVSAVSEESVVAMIAFNPAGSVVTPPPPQAPVADFIAQPSTVALGGDINFTDQSTNTPTAWDWKFGDNPPPSGIGLKYPPPVLSSPKVWVPTATNNKLNGSADQDYIIDLQNVVSWNNGIEINGGRNIVLIGGEVNFSQDWSVQNPKNDEGKANRGILISAGSGSYTSRVVHIEGVLFAGDWNFETFNIICTDGSKTTFQFQNIRVEKLGHVQETTSALPHSGGDMIHTQDFGAGYGPKQVNIDRLTLRCTDYQGIFDQGTSGNRTYSNVNLRGNTSNVDGPAPLRITGAGTQGKPTTSTSLFAGHTILMMTDTSGVRTLSNFYVYAPVRGIPQTIGKGWTANSGGLNFSQTWDQPDFVTLADCPGGSPSNYKSPGYGGGGGGAGGGAMGTSSQRNPVYRYLATGTYQVSLTAKNKDGESTKIKPVTVVPVGAIIKPVAAFDQPATPINVGTATTVSDKSSNGPTSWKWTFSDGAIATTATASHTFAAGTWTITLVASNSAGDSAPLTRTLTVNVPTSGGPPPVGTTPTTMRWVGVPTSTTIPIVSRTTSGATATCSLWVSTAADLSNAAQTAVLAPDSRGYVRHNVTGLSANKLYYYQVQIGGNLASDTIGTFRTAPVPMTPAATFGFGFASGSNDGVGTAFANCAARNPAFVLHTGDFHYNDYADGGLNEVYASMESKIGSGPNTGSGAVAVPALKTLLATRSNAYCWSDHDAGGNNSSGPDHAIPLVNQMYRALVPTPALPANGTYYAWTWGRVRFILCDTRSFKTPEGTDASPTADGSSHMVFGNTQRLWLKDQFDQSLHPEKLKFMIVDLPWNGPTSERVGNADEMKAYGWERTQIHDLIKAAGANVIIVHGDAHSIAADSGANNRYDTGGTYNIPIMAGAPWGNTTSKKGGTFSQGVYTDGTGFAHMYGYCTVSDDGTTIVAQFNGYDSNNASQVAMTCTYNAPGGPTPPPTATFTMAPSPVNAGSVVQFTDTTTPTATGFSWDFGDGSALVTGNRFPTHTYNNGGNVYYVTLTVTDSNGLTGSVTKPITVNASGTVPLTAVFSMNPASGIINAGGSVTFTNATYGGTPATYDWDFGDGSAHSTAVQPPPHTYPTAGTYVVILTGHNLAGYAEVRHTVTVNSVTTGSKLRWAPPGYPAYAGYTTITMAGRPASEQSITLSGNTILKFPTNAPVVRNYGLQINNGGNVVIIGGTVDIADGYASGSAQTLDNQYSDFAPIGWRRRQCAKFAGWTGVLHIEGLEFMSSYCETHTGLTPVYHRPFGLTEGIQFSGGTGAVQIQHSRISTELSGCNDTHTALGFGNHSDSLQTWVAIASIKVDGWQATTGYQGIMLESPFNGPLELHNVDFHSTAYTHYSGYLAGQVSFDKVYWQLGNGFSPSNPAGATKADPGTDMAPNAGYGYTNVSGYVDVGPPPPPPPPSAGTVIAAVSDIHCQSSMNKQQAVFDLVNSWNPAAVIQAGDLCYNGTTAQYTTQYNNVWGSLKSKVYPCPGNHEYYTAGAGPYGTYFGSRVGSSPNGYHYSVDVAGWHFISLDMAGGSVDGTNGSAQYLWLAADLTAHKTMHTVVFWHKPRFSAENYYNDLTDEKQNDVWSLLSTHRQVEFVINGHCHTYQRWARMNASKGADPINGIREFIFATGGYAMKGTYVASPNCEYEYGTGHNGGTDDGPYGAGKITLYADRYTVEYIRTTAPLTVLDSVTQICRTLA